MMNDENDPLQGFLREETEKARDNWISIIKKDFKLQSFLFALLFVEVIALLSFLSIAPVSWGTALSGALFLFTLFSCLSLKDYFTAIKHQKFHEIQKELIDLLRESFDGDGTTLEERRFIIEALIRSSKSLEGIESQLGYFKKFNSYFTFLFWHDLFFIRESLVKWAVQEGIERVKLSPLNPDLHVSLANSYVTLSELYKNEKRGGAPFQQILKTKFKEVSNRALLEFKILRQYDPKDPWILFQLAYTLGDLGRKEEELQAFVDASNLRPHDLDSLQKLGTLYFQSGRTLEGLEIFDRLRKLDTDRADELILHYS